MSGLLFFRDELGEFKDADFVDDALEVEGDFGLLESENSDKPEISEGSESAGHILWKKNS